MFFVTREWLKANATTERGCSWTREQLRGLGVRGGQHSWMFRIVGTQITDEQKARFEMLGARRRLKLMQAADHEDAVALSAPIEPDASTSAEYLQLIRKAKARLARVLGTRPKKAARVMTMVCRGMGQQLPKEMTDRNAILKKFLALPEAPVKPNPRSPRKYTPAQQPPGQPTWGDEFFDSREWQKLRYRVLKHYGRKCMLCGATEGVMHVDHIRPRSKYPALELEFSNLQVLCKPCNLGKGKWDETDWRTPESNDVFFVELDDPDRQGAKIN